MLAGAVVACVMMLATRPTGKREDLHKKSAMVGVKSMNPVMAAALFSCCMAGASNGLLAVQRSPFEEVANAEFARVEVCGYSKQADFKGVPDETVIESDCGRGLGEFVIQFRGASLVAVETRIKKAIADSRPVERTRVACRAMVTVTLSSGKPLRFFVTNTGELRAGRVCIIPRNQGWMDDLLRGFCNVVNGGGEGAEPF